MLESSLIDGENMNFKDENHSAERPIDTEPEWFRLVRQNVSSLKFGTVQITVHDSRVTQVERSEKVRLDAPTTIKSKIS
jgi:hypothetical protein